VWDVWGAEMKLGLKFDDNRTKGLKVLEFFVFFSKRRPTAILDFKIQNYDIFFIAVKSR